MKIAFLGDIALIGRYDIEKNSDVNSKLEYLKSELEQYDYVIGNLEAPLTNKRHTMVCKGMHLKSPEKNIEVLKYLGVSAVTLANNHIYDYSQIGVNNTVQLLKENGIDYCGIDGKYIRLRKHGEKINISGFCGYSSNGTHYIEKKNERGINLMSVDNLEKQLEIDRAEQSYSILALHYGLEHTNYPAYEHIKLMNYIREKKDVVIYGHHTHTIQGIQKEGNSVIAYSLGNAIFDDCISINGKVKVELNESNRKNMFLGVTIEEGKIVDYNIKGFYNNPEKGIYAYDIQEEIDKLSEVLGNIIDIEEYERMRKTQYAAVVEEKFGKKDIQWLLNRMNYYAIGSKIAGKFRYKKYMKEVHKIYEK